MAPVGVGVDMGILQTALNPKKSIFHKNDLSSKATAGSYLYFIQTHLLPFNSSTLLKGFAMLRDNWSLV